MDATPFTDRVLDDEGIAGGIGDAEAKLLIDWLVARLENKIGAANDDKQANEITRSLTQRARRIAKVTELVCQEHDLASAKRIWKESESKHTLDELKPQAPVDVVTQLIQWETEHDV